MANNGIDLLVGLQRELSDMEFTQVAEAFAASGVALSYVESGTIPEWNVPEVLRFRFTRPNKISNPSYSFLPISMVAVKGISSSQGYSSWYNPASWHIWPWNWFEQKQFKVLGGAIAGGAIGTVVGLVISSTVAKSSGTATRWTLPLALGVFGAVVGGIYADKSK